MVKMRNTYKILVGKPEERDHSEDRGVDGNTIFEWILGKYGGKLTGCIWFKIGTSGGSV
jgi:hypothetical protein